MEKSIKAALEAYPGEELYVYKDGTVWPLCTPDFLYKVVPNPKVIQKVPLGWYLLKDDSFAPTATLETAKGIVAYFDVKGQPRSISVEQTKACYCPEKFWICADGWDDGQANTEKILQVGKEKGIEMPATEWCVAQGGWHPAAWEIQLAFACQGIINTSLKAIGAKPLQGSYITSTEYGRDPSKKAWSWQFNDGRWYYNGRFYYINKSSNGRVRCLY